MIVGAGAPVVAVPAVVELAIISVAIALILLRRVWVSTFGHLLREVAKPIGAVNFSFRVFGHGFSIGFGWLAELITGVDTTALHLLGAGITATEWAANRLWQQIAYVLHATSRMLGDLAESTYRELSYLRYQTLPRYVRQALHPLASKVEWLIHRLEHLEVNPTTIIHRTVRVLDPRVASLERDVARLEHAVASTGAAVLGPPVAAALPAAAPVVHGIDAIRARLGKLTRELAPAAVAGLVAAALGALRLGWLKCSNVRRAGRQVCGMDADLLESLLAGTLVIFGTVSLVEFAEEMQVLIADIERPVRAFWRA